MNKEAQREELTKTLADIGRKLLSRQFQLEQLRSHNRISINSSAKEIHSLERRRQELIAQLKAVCLHVPLQICMNLSFYVHFFFVFF